MTRAVPAGRGVLLELCGVLWVLVEPSGNWAVTLVMRRSGVRLPKAALSSTATTSGDVRPKIVLLRAS